MQVPVAGQCNVNHSQLIRIWSLLVHLNTLSRLSNSALSHQHLPAQIFKNMEKVVRSPSFYSYSCSQPTQHLLQTDMDPERYLTGSSPQYGNPSEVSKPPLTIYTCAQATPTSVHGRTRTRQSRRALPPATISRYLPLSIRKYSYQHQTTTPQTRFYTPLQTLSSSMSISVSSITRVPLSCSKWPTQVTASSCSPSLRMF